MRRTSHDGLTVMPRRTRKRRRTPIRRSVCRYPSASRRHNAARCDQNAGALLKPVRGERAGGGSLYQRAGCRREVRVNEKNVGAGITLGSNGETSDMILYADRFSLFNRNNATAVPVMVAEGNELYIDTARIKNSSLTSTKIADGSITNAKIGNEIRSNDFVDGSRGWRIAKDGSSQFNNVIVRGAVYATDGWFQGTVYANHIEGDIGSFAINIAQHRTRKVPKATWQWFELARFRRQNFDQVINIRGGLLQTDSITIDGGAKLRAGMSYAPGSDGGLDPGYLSYAMLLRGTGATSGGGSMELGIELMYETGGATRLLTAQESMNVDNMSFVVPGDAVLRYGCYLDRNGQMVLTILSRFDAFAARNNNVIRGSST